MRQHAINDDRDDDRRHEADTWKEQHDILHAGWRPCEGRALTLGGAPLSAREDRRLSRKICVKTSPRRQRRRVVPSCGAGARWLRPWMTVASMMRTTSKAEAKQVSGISIAFQIYTLRAAHVGEALGPSCTDFR
jgi:hypothetical protein